MNSLELVSVLEVAVFGFAIAQMLMILLTIRRERDVRELRELVEDQRLHLTELRVWLAGRSTSQSTDIASESKLELEPSGNEKATGPTISVREMSPPDDAPARTAEYLEWQHDVADRLRAGINAQHARMPAADGFKWFKDDPNEPPELREARRIVSGKTNPSRDQDSQKGIETQPRLTQIAFSHVEVERALEAIKTLREDADKGSDDLNGKRAVNLKR